MARTLDQIIAELGSTYDPQIASIRTRQKAIPGLVAEEEKGLAAKQTQAFDDILGGARRRGIGFSGIPLAEQARYTSTEYLPALARLKQSGREQAMGLEDSILGIMEKRNTLAQQVRQQELDREEVQRQAAAQQRASAAQGSAIAALLGGGGRAPARPAANAIQRADRGFNFTDQGGKAISAAKYAEMSGKDIRDLLYDMGQSGDSYAAEVYNALRNVSPDRYGSANVYQAALKSFKAKYPAIFWGT